MKPLVGDVWQFHSWTGRKYDHHIVKVDEKYGSAYTERGAIISIKTIEAGGIRRGPNRGEWILISRKTVHA